MITKTTAMELLKELPEASAESKTNHRSIYKAMEWFSGYTRHLIETEELQGVRYCFSLGEKLWKEGDSSVKNAVENIYVYSLGNFIQIHDSRQMKEVFNGPLRKVYLKQVLNCKP